jgi:hypothetical protein
MSVETVASTNENNANPTYQSWTDKWDIEPYGYTTNIDDRFFDEDSPHKPPIIDVDVKLAADIQIREDKQLVKSVAEYWFPHDTERFIEVAEIVFNDISVWYLPLPPWDKDYENIRINIVDDFVSDVVQWKAIVDNRSPKVALEEWRDWLDKDDDYEWAQLISDTEMLESTRKWFNENADWLPHIHKTVESDIKNVELNDSDEMSWEDSW